MIRFILNPKSGKEAADTEYIAKCIQLNFPGADMRLTRAPKHATELAREAANQHFESVIVLGGDGTINEAAQGLVGTQTALGIIPRGSGNGLAREIKMFLPLEEALVKLQRATPHACDVGLANNELFLNVAGVGIEAAVAWQFMEHGKTGARGKAPYFTLGAKTFFTYKPNTLRVTADGHTQEMAPLTLVFANGRQYGSNFKIAPQASLTDGKLDMVEIKNAPKYKLAAAVPFFFTNKKPPFEVTNTTQITNAVIESDHEILYHIDGEPRKTDRRLEITVQPGALRLLLPQYGY